VILQVRAKVRGDRLRDLNRRKLDGTLTERVARERRSRDAARLFAIEERLDLPVPFHPVGETGPAGALTRGEHRPDQRKDAGGLDQQPGRLVRQMLPVQCVELPFEVIAHQYDREVRSAALDDANAKRRQSGFEFRCPRDVDRLNAHANLLEVRIGHPRRKPEARPIGGRGTLRRAGGGRDDEAAIDQPIQGFLDFVRRKIPFHLTKDLAKSLSGTYRDGERAIERAVKKELPVLGIEAHNVGRQHVGAEILRELRNVLALVQREAGGAIACHEVSTHASELIATSPDRRCKGRHCKGRHCKGRHCKARRLQVARAPSGLRLRSR
jgi:hypothetical protein